MRKLEPGMNDEQAQADRHGWRTTVGMVTGQGELEGALECGGPEVGNPYDVDPLGEDYKPVTYPTNIAMPPGKIGGAAPSGEMPMRSSGGGTVATAPQNYSTTKGSD